MDHLQLSLQTPKPSPRGTPVQTSEGNDSSSSSVSLVRASPLSAFALAPRRNYEKEFETRTTYIKPMTGKKLEFPPLDSLDSSEEESVPTFSLKRKRHNEDQDYIVLPSRSAKKLSFDRAIFRPIRSSIDEDF